MALQWVHVSGLESIFFVLPDADFLSFRHSLPVEQDNIDAFGGCKKKVTIWGESAGA